MRLLLTRAKLYVEGSGAAATAALLAGRVRVAPNARVVALVSGGNVDLEKIAGRCRLGSELDRPAYFAFSSASITPKVLPSVSRQ